MTQTYDIARASDGSLLRLAAELLRKDESATATFQAADGFSIELKFGGKISERISRTFNNNSFLITSGKISVPSQQFILQFMRAHTKLRSQDGHHRWQPSQAPFIDGIEFSGASSGDGLAILSAISSHLNFVPAAFGNEKANGPLNQAALILDRVSDAAAQVIEHTAERQRELDAHGRRLERIAREKIEQEKKQLQIQYENKLKEIESIEEALSVRSDELVARAMQLDDRENTHVRRELQKNMASLSDTALKNRLLSQSIWEFITPIALVIISVGFLAYFIILEIRNLDELANTSLR
jgi:hypothetical protein